MHELKDMLCRDLKEYERKGSISDPELERVHLITDTIKNIGKIEMQSDYSQGYGRGGHSYYDNNDNSYANRGQHYVRGHYSRGMADDIEEKMNDPHMPSRDKEALRRAMEILR